jgi:hypothetical protein
MNYYLILAGVFGLSGSLFKVFRQAHFLKYPRLGVYNDLPDPVLTNFFFDLVAFSQIGVGFIFGLLAETFPPSSAQIPVFCIAIFEMITMWIFGFQDEVHYRGKYKLALNDSLGIAVLFFFGAIIFAVLVSFGYYPSVDPIGVGVLLIDPILAYSSIIYFRMNSKYKGKLNTFSYAVKPLDIQLYKYVMESKLLLVAQNYEEALEKCKVGNFHEYEYVNELNKLKEKSMEIFNEYREIKFNFKKFEPEIDVSDSWKFNFNYKVKEYI